MSATSFADFITKAATEVAAVQTAIQDAGQIYSKLAEIVAAAEASFASQVGAGATKKAIVMTAIEVFVTGLGQAWDALKGLISGFIDTAISAYRAVTSAPVAPVPQS